MMTLNDENQSNLTDLKQDENKHNNELNVSNKNAKAFYYYEQVLGSPKFVCGPMVDQSEAAFRILCRKYQTHLGFTPMINANQFVQEVKVRHQLLYDCCQDRPLIVQFCCNKPEVLLEAAKLCVGFCDGIDLNLGCPQHIARRGHYGAFLQDEWDLLHKMVSIVHQNVPEVPISCKIRVFDSTSKTIEYAQMLEKAGCQMLTVHGRTRDQKGHNTGLANWDLIRLVKQSVSIPVIANGNIQSLAHAKDCLKITQADAVMAAEGLLHNPALFAGIHVPVWQLGEDYLQLVKKNPCPNSCIRGHLFKLFYHILKLDFNFDIRDKLAKASRFEDFENIVMQVRHRYNMVGQSDIIPMNTFPLPVHVSQPYFRPAPELSNIPKKSRPIIENSDVADNSQIETNDRDEQQLSMGPSLAKKIKIVKPIKIKTQFEPCSNCSNPKSIKCDFSKCRTCCKQTAAIHYIDCIGHKFNFSIKQKTTLIKS